MSKATSCKDAIAKWAKANEEKPSEAKVVKLMCQVPPIAKMDNKLNELGACEHLSLSTNSIEKLAPLPGCASLKILSLARNNIKRIEKLDDLANTLEELWLSYNQITKLDGLENMAKLRVLYLSMNQLADFDELLKLQALPSLNELLLLGNPMYEAAGGPDAARVEVAKRLPKLQKLDGELVSAETRAAAAA